MLIDGRVIYSQAGWIMARYAGGCCLCGAPVAENDWVICVAAHHLGGNWAGTCCGDEAEELSGYWLLRPRAPRWRDL